MLQGYLEYPTRKGVSHAAEVLQPLCHSFLRHVTLESCEGST